MDCVRFQDISETFCWFCYDRFVIVI